MRISKGGKGVKGKRHLHQIEVIYAPEERTQVLKGKKLGSHEVVQQDGESRKRSQVRKSMGADCSKPRIGQPNVWD